ncbi:MAG: nicotinate (nicotinamide) nucleotide adenylyltransferase [Fermentimonas sp.]|jgi:nicotinate-nucleotide adenylyltransferase
MKVGLFSGSFNPIHVGHLIVANYMLEFTSLDEVWFVVTPHSPLKRQEEMLDDQLRLDMVRFALKDYEGLHASDIEFRLSRPSFTVETLAALGKEYPGKEFCLIIGGDNWVIFDQWYEHECILQKHGILIYPRKGEEVNVPTKYRNSVRVVEAPLVEISSTFIRESLKQGKNMRAFLPPGVYDFILERGLYHSSPLRTASHRG